MNFRRDEPLTIKTKYLVYKGCKKNVHRLWKLNGDRGKSIASSSSGHSGKYSKPGNFFGTGLNSRDDEKVKRITDQTIQENLRTTEKMNQLRLKLELANSRKKLMSTKFQTRAISKLNKESLPAAPVNEATIINTMSKSHKTNENEIDKPMISSIKQLGDKVIQRQLKQERMLSAESKMKIKENLTRNRSFKSIMSTPTLASSSSLSFFNNEVNALDFCFSGSTGDVLEQTTTNKLGRSISFQSNYVFNRADSNLCVSNASGASSLATMEATSISHSTPTIQEYVGSICEPESSKVTGTNISEAKISSFSSSMQDLLLKEFLTKSTQHEASTSIRDYKSENFDISSFTKKSTNECAFDNKEEKQPVVAPSMVSEKTECFILPKLLIRESSPSVFESRISTSECTSVADSDVVSIEKPSTESLIDFYDNLQSSSTSSLVPKLNDSGCFASFHQPTVNRFYHSDLDLNLLNDRFKTKLSISNQDINSNKVNSGWSSSNLLLMSATNQTKDKISSDHDPIRVEDVNYDKFLNDLLNNDFGSTVSNVNSAVIGNNETLSYSKALGKENELIDLFGYNLDSSFLKKSSSRIPPTKKTVDKLKSFGSNPTLLGHHHSLNAHEGSNLERTTTTSTTTVHIPQLSRLDAIPTKYRRGESLLSKSRIEGFNF